MSRRTNNTHANQCYAANKAPKGTNELARNTHQEKRKAVVTRFGRTCKAVPPNLLAAHAMPVLRTCCLTRFARWALPNANGSMIKVETAKSKPKGNNNNNPTQRCLVGLHPRAVATRHALSQIVPVRQSLADAQNVTNSTKQITSNDQKNKLVAHTNRQTGLQKPR